MRAYPLAFLIGAALALAGCTGSTLYHRYQPLPDTGWERRDTIWFDLPIAEGSLDATLSIGLRWTGDIPLEEVVIGIEQQWESSCTHHSDTIRFRLTDSEGNAVGTGINIHQSEASGAHLLLKEGLQGRIGIHHLMTREPIPGITEIGIRISSAP